MKSKYLVVDKEILPEYFEKVVEARRLIEQGKVKNASEAIRAAGISRNTFYKYKDYVMEIGEKSQSKRAIISMMLAHEAGILAKIIQIISSYSFSIWTINQNPPVNSQANVVIALDIEDGTGSIDDMLNEVREIEGVGKVHLIGIE
jgi:chorismate mutase